MVNPEKLGVDVLTCCSGGKKAQISLADYARDKQLPADFLMSLGLRDLKQKDGGASIRIPYYDQARREVAARYRIALTGNDKFRWAKTAKPTLYGLWRLDPAPGTVILVQGESDCQTLWHYGLPALGAPGAKTWKADWAQYVDGLRVYVWQEPGEAGTAFVAEVGKSIPGCLVLTAPAGRKDISACHLAGDDVRAVIEDLKASATPYAVIREAMVDREAAEARAAAGALLGSADILGAFGELCRGQGLVAEDRIVKLLYLAITSRLLGKPVSVAVKGPSGGGKSFTVETALRAFPPGAYYALSSMSERALAYSEEPLQHRMLVLYEAAGMTGEFATYLMRTLLSEGRIRYETVEKTHDGLKPKLIERKGPTGLIVTTTAGSLHPENETRMFSVTVADDRKQTTGILLSLAERAAGRGHQPPAPDLIPWHALQTWLELAGVREVSIPYAHELARMADPRAVRLRRDFGAVLTLIATQAILHQESRGRDGSGRVVADLADYRAVYEVVIDTVSEGVQATVSASVRELVAAVKELDKNPLTSPVSVSRLADHLDIDKASVSRRVRVALAEGYVVNLEDKRGKPFKLKPGDPLPPERTVLPAPAELERAVYALSIPAVNTSTGQHPPCERVTADDGRELEDWQLSYLAEVEAMEA